MFKTVLESYWQGRLSTYLVFSEKRYLKNFLEKCKKRGDKTLRYPSKNGTKIVLIPILSSLDFKRVSFKVIPGTKIASFRHEWN